MVAAKRQQTSTVLYTLITFIALFIISTTFAVVFYVKYEEQRKVAVEAKASLDSVASEAQMRKGLMQIVGSIPPRTSGLQVMVELLDKLVTTITGGPVSDISAELKVENVKNKVSDTLRPLYDSQLDISFNDPNSTGLVRIIDLIRSRLENIQSSLLDLQDRYTQLNNQYDDAIITFSQTEQRLNSKVEQYKQLSDETLAKYTDLEDLFRQTAEQQVQNLRNDLASARTGNENLRDELLKKDAELELTKQMMKRAQAEIESIKPLPDSNAPAYVADGKIILVDTQTGIVHINIGSNDKVYRGLTFAVYDKNLPIPKTGEGKAEIEVFDVGQTISAARITTAIDPRNPIIQDDLIANLIWATKTVNTFVVAGDFEYGDEDKIKELIGKWGGKVDQGITIETDYVVLGRPPRVESRPSAEDMGIYPTALEKYEKSKKRYEEYQKIMTQAQALSIPIFNTDRFLYFTGYKEKAGRPGAF